MNQGNWLSAYAHNVHSQDGEDGITEKIFSIIPHGSWCAEIGAWDGLHLSNTAHLVRENNWSGVLVEGNLERFEDLCRNCIDRPDIYCVNAWVRHAGRNTLDAILSRTPIPRDFDLLSIDIDGNDYHIWRSTNAFRPKVVIVEFNNTIPHTVEYIQPPDVELFKGSSLLAFCNLGREKGYEMVASTEANAFFVDSRFSSLFEMSDNSPLTLNDNRKFLGHHYVA